MAAKGRQCFLKTRKKTWLVVLKQSFHIGTDEADPFLLSVPAGVCGNTSELCLCVCSC